MIHSLRHRPGLIILILAVIVAIGAFLRLYHHGDWLHFELDQARDAKIIAAAIDNGPGELPLQGPRAAGSFLRLGPAFYYIDYISALIFGDTPQGMAMLVAILSILSIPLFYLLLKIYFLPRVALALTAIYAISPFLVLYSRFSWNPNILPFFLILGMYGLLRSVDQDEKRRGLWLVVSSVALTIATQAHFVALLAIAVIVPVFLLIKRPRIALGSWILAIGMIGILYSPIIINDIFMKGKNVQSFIETFTDKSEESKHNAIEHGLHTFKEYALGYHLVLTGDEKTEAFKTKPVGTMQFDLLCDQECRKYVVVWMTDIALLAIACLLLVVNVWKERVHRKKDFLILMLVWFIVGSVLFYPIVFDVAPRFFLVTIVLPFVFLGLLAQWLMKHKNWGGSWLAGGLLLICVVLSGFHTYERFEQLYKASHEAVELPTSDRILKERGRVTLEVQRNVVEYMQSIQSQNGYPVFFYAEPFYKRSIGYLLDEQYIPNKSLKVNTVYEQGNYFFIVRSQANFETKFQDEHQSYVIKSKKVFGTLTVYHLESKPEAITDILLEFPDEPGNYSNIQRKDDVHKRYTWGEVFGGIGYRE